MVLTGINLRHSVLSICIILNNLNSDWLRGILELFSRKGIVKVIKFCLVCRIQFFRWEGAWLWFLFLWSVALRVRLLAF